VLHVARSKEVCTRFTIVTILDIVVTNYSSLWKRIIVFLGAWNI
jgi:hypothetical protein